MNRIMLMTALLGTAIGGTSLLYGDQPQPARPGTVNYVDGSAFLDGSKINSQSIGQAELDAGQVLTTQEGKAEILLTPGIYLRVGEHSAVKMISPEITPTIVEVQRGRAAIEVDEIYKQNDLQVMVGGVNTYITKNGYYEFRADQPSVLVYKGEARVDEGDGRYRKVKGSHELALAQGAFSKPRKLHAEDAKDSLFQWSSLRSQYLAEANQQIAGEYAGMSGFSPGWYWDPYGYGYTFIGLDPFFSPFGWGFYPPWYGGFYGGWGTGYYGGYYGMNGGYYGGGRTWAGHGGMRSGSVGSPRMGAGNSGFRGGVGLGGGGFHSGGSFHGGGFGGGGGFHGGGGRR